MPSFSKPTRPRGTYRGLTGSVPAATPFVAVPDEADARAFVRRKLRCGARAPKRIGVPDLPCELGDSFRWLDASVLLPGV